MVDCKVEDADAEEYLNGLNPDLMEVVYGWCNGAKWVEIYKKYTTLEREGGEFRNMSKLASVQFIFALLYRCNHIGYCSSINGL